MGPKYFRITTPEFAPPHLLLTGGGAKNNGGRWNTIGTAATYLASSLTIAAAEKGYHSVRFKVKLLAAELARSKNPAQFFLDNFVDLSVMCSEVGIGDDLDVIDLTNASIFAKSLAEAGLPAYSLQDSRKAPYELLTDAWTQKLATHLFTKGHQALKAPSARSDDGHIVVLYNEKLRATNRLELLTQALSKLSAVEHGGAKLKAHTRYDPNKVLLEHGGSALLADVFHFPYNV